MSEVKKSKILTVARAVFLRHGYKRVSMGDIAQAAGVSRAGLYVLFKNKEDIFMAVFLQWVDQTLASIKSEIKILEAPEQQLLCAFEWWTVRPFEMAMSSPEAKELIECSFGFAQDSLKQGYELFESAVSPMVALLGARHPAPAHMASDQIAHVLASATRGFKQTAGTVDELRQLIKDLLVLSFALDQDAFR